MWVFFDKSREETNSPTFLGGKLVTDDLPPEVDGGIKDKKMSMQQWSSHINPGYVLSDDVILCPHVNKKSKYYRNGKEEVICEVEDPLPLARGIFYLMIILFSL